MSEGCAWLGSCFQLGRLELVFTRAGFFGCWVLVLFVVLVCVLFLVFAAKQSQEQFSKLSQMLDLGVEGASRRPRRPGSE